MARLTARERREAYLREYSVPEEDGEVVLPAGDPARHHRQPLLRAPDRRAGDRLVRRPRTARRAASWARSTRTRPTPRSRSTTRVRTGTTSSSSSCCGSSTTRICCCSATIIIPTIWMGILIGMPFIDRTRERRVSRRPIAIGFAGAHGRAAADAHLEGLERAQHRAARRRRPGRASRSSRAQSCGSCHTLKAMGWGGNIGPNLDSAKPNYALAVDARDERRGADAVVQGHAHRRADQVHRDRRRDAHQGRRHLAEPAGGRLQGLR